MVTNKISFGTYTKFSTMRTDLASVEWINFDNINPLLHSFVADEVLQLVETPSIQPEVEFSSLPCLSYIFEVFQYNSSSVTICNNLFADNMVPMPNETSLFARNPFQEFLTTSSAFALEPCSQFLEFESISFNFSSTKELPIACYSNMVYSDINTNLKSVRSLVDVNVSRKCDMQEHPIIFINSEQSSLVIPIKILPIIFRNFNRNTNPSINGCKPNFIKTKGECPLIKIQRHTFFKDGLRAFSGFDAFKSLRSYSVGVYDKLRRQFELISCFVITKMVKLVSIINARSKSFISNIRDSFGVLLHSVKKQIIERYFDFDCCYRLHNKMYNHNYYINVSDNLRAYEDS